MACSTPELSVDKYLAFAEELLKKCKDFATIEGSSKLGRKITSEIKFLKSLKTKGQEKIRSHLKSSNLSHYAGVIHAVEYLPDVIQVLQPFTSPNKSYSLLVDVVAGQGHMWVKVVARKAQALHLVWAGKGQFGERDLVEQADEYIDCKEIHPINFLSPEINFLFYNNVTNQMAEELESKDIKVFGHRVNVEDNIKLKLKANDFDESDDENFDTFLTKEFLEIEKNKSDLSKSREIINETHGTNESAETCEIQTESLSQLKINKLQKCAEKFSKNGLSVMNELLGILPDLEGCSSTVVKIQQHISSIQKVNLDITTLIALVSSVTHGGCNYIFKESILSQQAVEEREQACVPIINSFLQGKELYVCKSALEDFNEILDTLGGEGEKLRAEKLLKSVTILEDSPSQRALQLEMFGKVKDRSRTIFGTGDNIKAITMTANSGFVRAARNQGVSFCVYFHPARALTETKEKTATAIS